MAVRVKKFEKMIRGDPDSEQGSFEKETINAIRFGELECLQQRIFVNSLSHIKDEILLGKCSDIITHYRLFKTDESHYNVKELSDDEKLKLKKIIGECIQIECAGIINEKKSIPTDLLELIDSEPVMPNILKNKLNNMLSLLNKYMSNKNEINNSIFKLLDSSYVNILEAQKLAKQIDVVKANSHKFQSDIISKFNCSEELYKSLEKHYNTKEKEYSINLLKLEYIQELQNKYKQVDGPQYRALVKRFIQAQEIIKVKSEMFNAY